MTLSLLLGLLLSAHGEPLCQDGRVPTADGHCCWEGQAWSGGACAGAPTACPEGRWVSEEGCYPLLMTLMATAGESTAGEWGEGSPSDGEAGEEQPEAPESAEQRAAPVEGVVTSGEVEIEGDAERIEPILRRYRGQLQYCYARRLKEVPDLEGRVEVLFSVSGGRVVEASVLSDTTGDADVGDCVVRKVRAWRFVDGEEATVVYPIILSRR